MNFYLRLLYEEAAIRQESKEERERKEKEEMEKQWKEEYEITMRLQQESPPSEYITGLNSRDIIH